MAPIKAIWAGFVYLLDVLTISQTPYLTDNSPHVQLPVQSMAPFRPQPSKYPIFNPPDDLEDVPFRCEYPNYAEKDGWVACNTNVDRGCWLKNIKTGQRFDIDTDYERNGPTGIERHYYLEIAESTRNPDGFGSIPAQLFNNSFPAPRLQACWGDRVKITVKNKLFDNGTSVHWHGFRQLNSVQMDGVNAITQCPIAPGDEFTYDFNITQYGTSWYHSHYSLQYAAGAMGAFTVYGPMSKSFDHQLYPIIMSDWLHESVYEKWDASIKADGSRILINNILQNGIGHWPPLQISEKEDDIGVVPNPKFNEVYFQKGVKYLMRVINAAADTTFIFSIDNHKFWVVSTDFVAVEPYYTDHVVVGIGQRYNIIVDAIPDQFSHDQNYWIRTSPAPNCTSFNSSQPIPDEHTGIVRYTLNDRKPTTSRQDFKLTCADETYFRNITPKVPWTVSPVRHGLDPFYLNFHALKSFPYYPCNDTVGRFELVSGHPMWLNFSDPTLLGIHEDFSQKPWLAVVDEDSKPSLPIPNNTLIPTSSTDQNGDTWIQLTIISGPKQSSAPLLPHPVPKVEGAYVPGSHPIHLHGHDFAILDQCVPDSVTACDASTPNLTLHNPPRRDVAFLPDNGYLIIAFKADNPGVWIMHCHIAFHASSGLAAQIIERKDEIEARLPRGWESDMEEMCRKWDEWNPRVHQATDPCGLRDPEVEPLQLDSGI